MRLFLLLFCLSLPAFAALTEEDGYFSGYVSRVNEKASLVRVKIAFENARYLNKKDAVQFWNEHNPKSRCTGKIVGKSSKYLLMKIPQFSKCTFFTTLSQGVYLKFFSQDFLNNLKMGKEVTQILLKKRMALSSRLRTTKSDLDAYMDKTEAVNQRYDVLRAKLEKEWADELAKLEEDRTSSLRDYKNLEARLYEIDNKLEQYKVSDENLVIDRWALDPNLYYKK